MDFTEILTIFAIVAPIIYKATDFVKFLRAGDLNASVTQALVWVLGVVLLFLLSQTDFAGTITVGNSTLDRVNGATLIFIGLAGGSLASAGYDWKRARDNNDSAVTPLLIPTVTKDAA